MGISASNPKGADKAAKPRFGRMDLGLESIAEGVARAKDWLFSQQHPDGYWCGELEADSML
jgi:squalene-hopene/tetraprenyl-beta-curcumene cyclase